ncbi:GNAT family N-acetyltransferase [Pontibacter sp. CAU 1760]
MEVKHEEKFQQFTIETGGGEEAELAYARPEDKVIDFTHTFVPPDERGQGLANKLVKTGLEYAEANSLKVVATCPMVAKYIQKNEAYQKLLANK